MFGLFVGAALSVGLLPAAAGQESTEVSGPSQVSAALNGSEWFSALDGASDIEVFSSGTRTYAMVAANNKVSIRDITDLAHPAPVWGIYDDTGRFTALHGVVDVEVFKSGGRTYAMVAAARDSGIQIMDITDPARPTPTSAVFDGSDGLMP